MKDCGMLGAFCRWMDEMSEAKEAAWGLVDNQTVPGAPDSYRATDTQSSFSAGSTTLALATNCGDRG